MINDVNIGKVIKCWGLWWTVSLNGLLTHWITDCVGWSNMHFLIHAQFHNTSPLVCLSICLDQRIQGCTFKPVIILRDTNTILLSSFRDIVSAHYNTVSQYTKCKPTTLSRHILDHGMIWCQDITCIGYLDQFRWEPYKVFPNSYICTKYLCKRSFVISLGNTFTAIINILHIV